LELCFGGWFDSLLGYGRRLDKLFEVLMDCCFEVIDAAPVGESVNGAVVYKDFEVVFFRERVELVLNVFGVLNVFLFAEYDPLFKVNGLTHDCIQYSRIVQELSGLLALGICDED
jgi:hypothetical protein